MLKALPAGLGALTRLEKLDLWGCSGLTALPDEIGALTRLETLNLSCCSGLTALPDGIRAPMRQDLECCSGLTALPAGLGALTRPSSSSSSSFTSSASSSSSARFGPAPSGQRRTSMPTVRSSAGRVAGRPRTIESARLLLPARWSLSSTTLTRWQGAAPLRRSRRKASTATVPARTTRGGGVCRCRKAVQIQLVAHIHDAAGHCVYRASHGPFMSTEALFLHVVRSDAPEGKAAAAVLAWFEAVQQLAMLAMRPTLRGCRGRLATRTWTATARSHSRNLRY